MHAGRRVPPFATFQLRCPASRSTFSIRKDLIMIRTPSLQRRRPWRPISEFHAASLERDSWLLSPRYLSSRFRWVMRLRAALWLGTQVPSPTSPATSCDTARPGETQVRALTSTRRRLPRSRTCTAKPPILYGYRTQRSGVESQPSNEVSYTTPTPTPSQAGPISRSEKQAYLPHLTQETATFSWRSKQR